MGHAPSHQEILTFRAQGPSVVLLTEGALREGYRDLPVKNNRWEMLEAEMQTLSRKRMHEEEMLLGP